jgi:hypothetical protein
MNKPNIKDFSDPRAYTAACLKYAQGIDPDPAVRADSKDEDEDADADDAPTVAPRLEDFDDPRGYVEAVRKFQKVQRLDSTECTTPDAYRMVQRHDDGSPIDA